MISAEKYLFHAQASQGTLGDMANRGEASAGRAHHNTTNEKLKELSTE